MFSFDRLDQCLHREKRNKSYICALLQKSNSYINDLKRHGREPSDEQIEKIAAALNTTPAYLCGDTDDPAVPQLAPEILQEQLAFYGSVTHGVTPEQAEDLTAIYPALQRSRQLVAIQDALRNMSDEELANWYAVIVNPNRR